MYAVPAREEISASYLEDKYRETTVLPRLRILRCPQPWQHQVNLLLRRLQLRPRL